MTETSDDVWQKMESVREKMKPLEAQIQALEQEHRVLDDEWHTMLDRYLELDKQEMETSVERQTSPEIIRQKAEIEASIKGTTEIERDIEAWIKEHPND